MFYYARVIGPGYFQPASETVPLLGTSAAAATGVAAFATVAIGVVAEPLLAAFTNAQILP